MTLMAISTGLNRLRVWKPLLTKREVDDAKRALRQGLDLMRQQNGTEKATPRALIWFLMQDAAETWRRLPDPLRAKRLYSVMWPDLARPSEDNRRVEWEIALEEAVGVRFHDSKAYHPRFQITDPAAQSRAETVFGWLKFVKAKNRRRDISAFIALAEGRGSRAAAAEMGRNVTDYAVRFLKDKVLRQIEEGLTKSIDLSQQFVYKETS